MFNQRLKPERVKLPGVKAHLLSLLSFLWGRGHVVKKWLFGTILPLCSYAQQSLNVVTVCSLLIGKRISGICLWTNEHLSFYHQWPEDGVKGFLGKTF